MPYIKQEDRDRVLTGVIENVGELNFFLSVASQSYLLGRGLSYQSINDVIGAFEAAKQEFYRRVAVPYEDMKKNENGDVFIDWNAVVQGKAEKGTETEKPDSARPAQPEVQAEDQAEEQVAGA